MNNSVKLFGIYYLLCALTWPTLSKIIEAIFTILSAKYARSSHNAIFGTEKNPHQVNFTLSEYSLDANFFN